jgi:hypothetical protein
MEPSTPVDSDGNYELDRRRIRRYRWIVWAATVTATAYAVGISEGILDRPAPTIRLALKFFLGGLWVLAGIGLWRSQQLDKRLKGKQFGTATIC